MRFLIALIYAASIPAHAFDWVPDGTRPRELPPQCSTELVEQIVMTAKSGLERSQKIAKYFADCDQYLTFLGQPRPIDALAEMVNISYQYFRVPHLKTFEITTEDGTIIHALMALKPDDKPRPLVVIQCGMTCDIKNSKSIGGPLIHFFDESPFNVIFLGSSTSAQFAVANKKVYVGGALEGRYLYEVAKWAHSDKSGIKERISSIHLAGYSLGGHAAIYGSTYAALEGKLPVNSVQGMCPVVDLKASITTVMRQGTPENPNDVGRFMQAKIWEQISEMLGKVPVIDRLIPDGKQPDGDKMKEVVSEASLDYYRSTVKKGTIPKSVDEYWFMNIFTPVAPQVTTPMFLWSSADDPAVFSTENSLQLLPYANKEGSKIEILDTKIGSHCAFEVTHGWDVSTTLLRSFVLAHSPEFLPNYKSHSVSVADAQTGDVIVKGKQVHFSQRFALEAKSDVMGVTYRIFNPELPDCDKADPFLVSEDANCFEEIEAKIPLAKLNIPILPVPENSTAAQVYTRWANTNLKIVGEDGKPLLMTTANPKTIHWKEL